ncbi:hypothetical protein [Variovorax paradoxus]|uniref:hypothetical protein n=1 Tax=Variovorax paradoxus TaxID=34073 RepID=UPI003D660041
MLKQSFLRFMRSRASSPEQRDKKFRVVRSAMLEALPICGDPQVTQIAERISYAIDIEALWYLRADVMSILSGLDGEASALREMREIDAMFEGGLPQSVKPRAHHAGPGRAL